MKTTIPQKTPETAFWARRIFSARMPAKTAGRKIAMAFRRFAKDRRQESGGQMSEVRSHAEKPAFLTGCSLPAGVKLRFYAVALRFKRCSLTPECHANPAKGFGWPAEKYGRMVA